MFGNPISTRLLFVAVVAGVLLLALGGWTVRGARWTVTAPRRRLRPEPALA